ncbi:MAG: DUF4349 domain-containing protein [Bacteroides sp.]|nr:DUF4349 domain-containing protein [Bacteroides sp.]
MKTSKLILRFAFFFLVLGCAQDPHYESATSSADMVFTEDMIPVSEERTPLISSSAAVVSEDTTRRFIRTADLRFKVKSVIESTYDIEKIAAIHKGFVTSTSLKSYIDNVTTTAISADSVLETTYYTVSNTLVLRVPVAKLDTALKDIARNIEFLDHRTITAENVAFQLQANEMIRKRVARNEGRLTQAIDNRGKKLKETTSAEELLFKKQEEADKALLSTFSLEDKINFSTINLYFYQRPDVRREVIANQQNIKEYEPGFGSKLIGAVKQGWLILELIFLFLVDIWSILLLAGLGYLAFRGFRKKGKGK